MKKYICIFVIISFLMTGCEVQNYSKIEPETLTEETDGKTVQSNAVASSTDGLYANLDIPESYSIPDIVCPSGELIIHVDAGIKAPNVPLPIARVRKTGFTSALIERFANVLFGNAKQVAADSIYRTPTKGYLQREIDALQADIDAWDSTIQSKYEIYNGKEEAQEGLEKLMEQMESAPDTLPAIVPDYSHTDVMVTYLAMPDDQTVSRIDIFQPDIRSMELAYSRDSLIVADDVTGRKEDVSGLVTVSEDLELNDFACAGSSAVKYEFGTKGSYVFYFTRQVNGATETYTNAKNYCSASTDAIDAGTVSLDDVHNWQYEQIHVLVDDDGVLSLMYLGPCEVTGIISDQALNLMPFSEIANIFQQNISRLDQPNSLMSYTKDYYITDIVLGLMSVPEDDYETALLTPVWDFMGYIKTKDGEMGINRCEPFFTVNAIDGSIINRGNNYQVSE
jgi:hypothetical protein